MYLFLSNLKKAIRFLSLFAILAIINITQAQGALEFNGTNSYVEIPHAATNNTAQFTVEFWARVDGGTGAYRAPLSNRDDNPLRGYNFYATTGNIWTFSGGTGATPWVDLEGPAVIIGEWTHLAATYDGSTYRFYVNGILEGTPRVAGFSPNTTRPLRIGAGTTEGAPQFFFPGAVDEVKIWNYARSESEINDNKNIDLPVPQTGLISYYQFEDGSANSKIGNNNGILNNSPTLVTGVSMGTTAPTIISGASAICIGNSTTLTASGGTTYSNVVDVWYAGACGGEAFSEGWDTQPYATGSTTVNSTTNGILNVTSTSTDPAIEMYDIGSFNPLVNKYINIRYKVVSGTANHAQIFYLNEAITVPDGGYYLDVPLISDNTWRIATLDMSAHPNWTDSNITGWRFDYATSNGVTMDIDFIQLVASPIIGTGTSISVTPNADTTYYVNRKGPNANTVCVSQVVTVNALPIPTFTAQPVGIIAVNTDVTYTTEVSQTNYVWTIPGVLNTDYSITSGGTTADNTVVLKWLTADSKAVTVNYSNSNNCSAAEATSSASIITRIRVLNKFGNQIIDTSEQVNQNGAAGFGSGLSKNGMSIQIKSYVLTDGLVMHLDAGDIASYSGTGTTWTDLSGNGNNGILQNGVGYNSANEGALVFDGVDDYFVTDNNLDLSDTDKITIQIVIKYSSVPVSMILEHSTDWNSNNAFGVLSGQPSGKMQFTDHNQGYNAPHSTNTLNDNNWHFFSVTVDRSQAANNQSLIYVDGVLNHTQTSLNTDTSGNYSSLPLFIGSRAGINYFFNGNIAQVLIYKRALTAAEVQQNFNMAKSRYGL
ncbi:Concanavalin A-like lectin/glucanases superfamily protein [Flaviramulus basaltis]|uniref:Concanavalin A-like lectin/glucanases superfamily protein n=1 Tax=Flaviramulus basaltis TaxID=369401 RepID=A0A1K2ILD8_9FLAO|nr:LamG-like jellyroll fold domain-containing protein [Flaviramulus basaltis]SFZ93257.1 Concanavalin A-like lectin/glucanases superfamily protein [Flaviramulus basaltis]